MKSGFSNDDRRYNPRQKYIRGIRRFPDFSFFEIGINTPGAKRIESACDYFEVKNRTLRIFNEQIQNAAVQ